MSNKKSSFLSKFGHAFDLWLIPQGNKPVKRLRVERWHWMVGMGVGGGFLLTLVGTAFLTSAGYWYYQSAYWKLKNQSQMMEVYEKEKVEYIKKLALLEKSVQDAQKMTTQLASLVGQEKIPLKAGIGPINMHPGDKRLEAAALKFDLEIEKPLTFDRFSALDKMSLRFGARLASAG